MAIKIRLARFGTKKKPFYSVVVTDSRSPRDSSYIEKLGTYNPLLGKDDPKRAVLNIERIQHWMKIGAKPSEVVERFLRKAGAINTPPRVYTSKRLPKKAKGEAAAAPAAEAAPAA